MKFYQKTWFSWILILIIVIVFCLVSFANINDYGITWDEDLHHQTGAVNVGIFREDNTVEEIEGFSNLRYYGSFGDMIGHLFYETFTLKLGWLDEIASHHIHIILFGAVLLLSVFWLARKTHGLLAALFATGFLLLFPRFIAHSQVNMKDLPVAALFTLTILLFYLAVTKKKAWLFILAGVVLGLDFAIKVNALWIPIIMVPWFLFAYRDKIWLGLTKRKELDWSFWHGLKKWGWGLILSPIVAVAAAVLFWPWTWASPISRLFEVIQYLGTFQWEGKVWYQDLIFTVDQLPWHYAPLMLLFVTPVIILVLAGLGITISSKDFKTLKNKGGILYILWFALVFAVIFALDVGLYDGIRHFFIIVPAMALLAGVGTAWVYQKISKLSRKNWRLILYLLVSVILVISGAAIFRKMMTIHPYELYYYNKLIGGMGGAYHYVEVGYWGQEFREGVQWLNENAEPNARVALLPADKMGRRYLRDDLILVKETEDPDYVVHLTKTAFEPFKNYEPIYVLEVDGAPLLKIKKIENKDAQ